MDRRNFLLGLSVSPLAARARTGDGGRTARLHGGRQFLESKARSKVLVTNDKLCAESWVAYLGIVESLDIASNLGLFLCRDEHEATDYFRFLLEHELSGVSQVESVTPNSREIRFENGSWILVRSQGDVGRGMALNLGWVAAPRMDGLCSARWSYLRSRLRRTPSRLVRFGAYVREDADAAEKLEILGGSESFQFFV